MSVERYEAPDLTVLGGVADLTAGADQTGSDNAGADGGGSAFPITNP